MHITAEEAIERFRQGEMIILVDDENRENEGDFVIPAQFVEPDVVNTMITHGRGMVCVLLPEERAEKFGLHLMVGSNTSKHGTNFTVSVDHVNNDTGISAYDRSMTIKAFVDPSTKSSDFCKPGHISPIIARPGGVLQRAGHTEGVVDMCRMAGLQPVGVLCEIIREDGRMARMPDLEVLAKKMGLPICAIKDLITHRLSQEKLVEKVADTILPNDFGEWRMRLYENRLNGELHTALVLGEPEKQDSALVRVHSQCFTGDTLGSKRCDCGSQLEAAEKMIADEGAGVLLYLQQEGRGIGLKAKIQAYGLQDEGKDTVEANKALGHAADPREYGIGAQILTDLGLRRLRVMTNNPRKLVGLKAFGLEIVERVPLEVAHNEYNKDYLETKVKKLDHLIGVPTETYTGPEDQ